MMVFSWIKTSKRPYFQNQTLTIRICWAEWNVEEYITNSWSTEVDEIKIIIPITDFINETMYHGVQDISQITKLKT